MPNCPNCGAPMVLRTARRGPNAGGQFYGCSNYPRCKSTLPFENDEDTDKKDIGRHTGISTYPVNLIARSRNQMSQVRFIESIATTQDALEILDEEEPSEWDLQAFSQWRLDFPLPDENVYLDEKTRQIITVAEKILTRGRITLCSPTVERRLKEMFPENPIFSLEDLLISCPFKLNPNTNWYDSSEEQAFESIMRDALGDGYTQWLLPQVEITSLLPRQEGIGKLDGRVDFVISHPRLNKSCVVEIDGVQHDAHQESDQQRDNTLRQYGYDVFRIPAREINAQHGPAIDALLEHLAPIGRKSPIRKFSVNYFSKLIHQIQLCILEAIKIGLLDAKDTGTWRITTDIDQLGICTTDKAAQLLDLAVSDLLGVFRHLASIYGVDLFTGELDLKLSPHENKIHLSFTGESAPGTRIFTIQNIFVPFHIANSTLPTTGAHLDKPAEKDLLFFLEYIFRKQSFWEGQYEAIAMAMQGRDAIVLLPTGAGKSLVYQLSAMLLPGRAVVVEPIISLIEDQLSNLESIGIDRIVGITSQMETPQERLVAMELFAQGEYLFAYVAPERFQIADFRNSLRTLTVHTPIALVAVDEAHCVSEWGHDFRTAYLNIGRTSRDYCSSDNHTPPLLALTGTASRAVLKDVQRELQIDDFDAIITPKSFDRPELKFHVIFSSSAEKFTRLKGYLSQMLPGLFSTTNSTLFQTRGKDTYSGLVFCPWVNGEFGVVEVANRVQRELSIPTSYYAGKQPKNWTEKNWRKAKQNIARSFKKNRIPLLISTKAFGMGIDKPNIRYTIHFGLPNSIESFYQEAGRAGRDRRTAHCCILVSDDNNQRTRRLLDPATRVESIIDEVQKRRSDDDDDITRALFFHTNAFKGVTAEHKDVEVVLNALGDSSRRRTLSVVFPDLERNNAEKALHRLIIIGVVEDYTINYAANEFTVRFTGYDKEQIVSSYTKYVGSYLASRSRIELEKSRRFTDLPYKEFVLRMVGLLLEFIYEIVERGRRRALYEILLAATTSPSDNDIRQRMLKYLESTEYSAAIEELLADPQIEIEKIQNIFAPVASPNDAAELRGQVSRYLESYPDHPGLLMLRAVTEMFTRDASTAVAQENYIAAVVSARQNYGLSGERLHNLIFWGLSELVKRKGSLPRKLIEILLPEINTQDFARRLIQEIPIQFADLPAWYLLDKLDLKLGNLFDYQ